MDLPYAKCNYSFHFWKFLIWFPTIHIDSGKNSENLCWFRDIKIDSLQLVFMEYSPCRSQIPEKCALHRKSAHLLVKWTVRAKIDRITRHKKK